MACLKNATEGWNMYNLSAHPSLTFGDVLKMPHLKWDLEKVSKHPNITMHDFSAHPEFPWDRDGLSQNPNVTIEDVSAHRGFQWNYYFLSYNPNVPIEYILAHPELPWALRRVKKSSRLWDDDNFWRDDVTIDHVKKKPRMNWSSYRLTKSATRDEILQNPYLPWCSLVLSRKMTMHDIFQNPHMLWHRRGWCWYEVLENPNLDIEILLQNIDLVPVTVNYTESLWWTDLTRKATLRHVLDHPDLNWSWDIVSRFSDLRMSVVSHLPQKPWDWEFFSQHLHSSLFCLERAILRHISASKIQRCWRTYIKRTVDYSGHN